MAGDGMSWLGFNWTAVRRGLVNGTAIGVGFVLAQYLEQWMRYR